MHLPVAPIAGSLAPPARRRRRRSPPAAATAEAPERANRKRRRGAPSVSARPLYLLSVLLELAQDRVAARDRIVERGFGLALASEHAFEILGDDVADLHQIAESQAARILGRRFAGQL